MQGLRVLWSGLGWKRIVRTLSGLSAPLVRPHVEQFLRERFSAAGRAELGRDLAAVAAALAKDDVARASDAIAAAIGGFRL